MVREERWRERARGKEDERAIVREEREMVREGEGRRERWRKMERGR